MPLDVLGTSLAVVEAARDVRIDPEAVRALAQRLAARPLERPAWRRWPHWWEDSPRTATYVLVLDALNFSFWGEPRWRVHYGGETYDGYWALAAALRRGLDEGWPLLDPAALARVGQTDLEELLRGDGPIPLIAARVANLREVGRVLIKSFGGSFAVVVEESGRSARNLVEAVAAHFSSFADVATYDGRDVQLYKRAQILVSDLVGAYDGQGLGEFVDLDVLTAFADYKVPQVLRADGLLVYSPALAAQVDALQHIPAGDPREVELRAATIWAVELLRRELAALGRRMLAFELDWLIWSGAQGRALPQPYHRTRTMFY